MCIFYAGRDVKREVIKVLLIGKSRIFIYCVFTPLFYTR